MSLRIHATLLPGHDERDVFVTDDGLISFDPSVGPDARTVLDGGFVLPGLADVHAHLALRSPAGDEASDRERVAASARAQLENGILAIREPGGPNGESATLGPADGLPRVFSAGRWLAPSGRFFEGWAREVEPGRLAEAAVEEAAAGGWAKVIGDWRVPEGLAANYASDEIARTATAVHGAGGRLAVHALTRDVIEMAIEAGADSIEHGVEIEPQHAEAMAARGIAFVPTMCAVGSPAPPELEESVRARAAARAERHPTQVRTAWEAGVLVLAGTDLALPHGSIRDEVRTLAAAGLTNEAALGAASWAARSFLGLPGLEEGAPADLVAFDRDPLEDLGALSRPRLVVLDGRVVRLPPL